LDVLAYGVELDRALDAVERHIAVQVGDDLGIHGLGILNAAGGLDRLLHHLADRVGLGHVGVHVGRAATVDRDVLADHGLAGGIVIAGIPGVWHHHAVGVLAADRTGEGGALVGTGGR